MNSYKPNLHNPEPGRLGRVKELAPEAPSFSSPRSDAWSPALNDPDHNCREGQRARDEKSSRVNPCCPPRFGLFGRLTP